MEQNTINQELIDQFIFLIQKTGYQVLHIYKGQPGITSRYFVVNDFRPATNAVPYHQITGRDFTKVVTSHELTALTSNTTQKIDMFIDKLVTTKIQFSTDYSYILSIESSLTSL